MISYSTYGLGADGSRPTSSWEVATKRSGWSRSVMENPLREELRPSHSGTSATIAMGLSALDVFSLKEIETAIDEVTGQFRPAPHRQFPAIVRPTKRSLQIELVGSTN
ncbi:hypothetical protein DTO169E5_4016 [Paecilomyces variotii]|nr:hypothetical protein DTO169E5_4016 [Paecilomyces variotii]KAJ9407170.1 hypothetical protein DTO045G8_5019 [Paecilomyces variotii]